MTIAELQKALPYLFEAGVVPHIIGFHGIGKSALVKAYADSNDLDFVDLRLGQMADSGDILGLATFSKDESGKDRTKFALPTFFPTKGKGILFLDECFVSGTKIITDSGIKSIATIHTLVQRGESVKVKSFNEETKTFEYKQVTKSWNKGKKSVITLKLNNTKTITCTPNHPFLTNAGWVEAGKLKPNTPIVANVVSAEKSATPALNPDQLHLMYGLILGDGCVGMRNSGTRYLSNIHSTKQREYIEYKANVLQRSCRLIQKNGYAQTPALTFDSRAVAEFYGKSKRELTIEALTNLNSKSLAIWFMDDGSKVKDCAGYLHTEGWDLDLVTLASRTLSAKGYKNSIKPLIARSSNKTYNYIYLHAEGFKKLCSDIAPYVHPSMRYKLLSSQPRVPFVPFDSKFLNFGYYIFKGFTETSAHWKKSNTVYDIEVQDNHNFVVCSDKRENGVVVHNCNRATKDILQAVFQLVLDKRIGEYKLPAGWHVVTASNPNTDEYSVTSFEDAAFLDRFCHIKLTPTVKEWIKWAKGSEIHPDIVGFIEEHPKMLEVEGTEFVLPAKPSRRSYHALSRILKQDPPVAVARGIAYGLIGVEAGTALIKFQKDGKAIVLTPQEILKSFDTEEVQEKLKRVMERHDVLNKVGNDLVESFEKRTTTYTKAEEVNVVAFIKALPKDFALGVVDRLHETESYFCTENDQEFGFGNNEELAKHIEAI